MKLVLVLVLFVLCLWSVDGKTGDRTDKLFGLFSVVRFPNVECTHQKLKGLCYPASACTQAGGTPQTTKCASGYGRCCIFKQYKCDSTFTKKISYILDPDQAAGTYQTDGKCKYTIDVDDDTCQVLLEIKDFMLTAPSSGVCAGDKMMVTGNNGKALPVLCGENMADQHMYIPVDKGTDINVVFMLVGKTTKRKWMMRYTKIDCSSTEKLAPSGCLQYYTETTGQVMSFGYKTGGTGEQLRNLDYTICVKQDTAFTKIQWEVCDKTKDDFLISDGGGMSDTTGCTKDYINILSLSHTDGSNEIDRLCGEFFDSQDNQGAHKTLMSKATPFLIRYHTDNTFTSAAKEKGFCLKYQQA